MGLYKNTPGNVLVPIAGRGKAEYGASTVRTGSVALEDIASHTGKAVDVVFDTPMPDNDYIVVLDALDGYSDTLSYVARDNTKGKTKF